MKIEKLNENKIQITFNNCDLQANNVDIHSFMSNSIESQSLFLHMLDEAEREVGFISDNYKLGIDAIALSNGTFILTVTRIEKEVLKSTKVQAHRKNHVITGRTLIYKFANFDDLCNFTNFLSVSSPKLVEKFADSNLLYKYNDVFFLILENVDNLYSYIISNIISEFAMPMENSDLIIHKIKECGLLVSSKAIHN